ncbi:DUF2891 domain-containing protein [Lichenifustis flavocetrariae]|uniref:DUF2891 domain-containing protein n=1 Tax=Lichenifustis flavocetrariae TaxID=2949735 RepID=A0AA42CM95_9HYPH|nr:DUF2891 domain-containing protein [Lichenifustis flavocetrariae]MCW6508162.1 DUF2891 domain-containing protein [Lichenifustis flavocetrariae]
MMLNSATATSLAGIGLSHVAREYPHKLDHVIEGPDVIGGPRHLHPVFFGSFDWHSCVHTYWMLARLLRLYPEAATSRDTRLLFDEALTPERMAGECAYFARPAARGFERPYGWAWLLALSAELRRHADQPWAAAVAPLATLIGDRFKDFLPRATYPIRAGTHGNTAFALRLAADDAVDTELISLIEETARRWYGADVDCQAWEPSGDDFLSSALIEAECMRHVLSPEAFLSWFDRFLPQLGAGVPATLFLPAVASDRTDGKIAHLDGLNLSRAWCWRSLLRDLPDSHPVRTRAEVAVAAHLAASLPALDGHYMGAHWLASFALLALQG